VSVGAPAYEGLFRCESLDVSLGFSRADYEAAAAEMMSTGRPPEDIKTYIHELTHYTHHTTTPYGLFVHYCRELQTADTIELVVTLLGAGVEPVPPLLTHVPLDLDGAAGSTVRGLLTRWINTEIFVASLGLNQQKLDVFLQWLTGGAARVPLLPLLETFRRLQGGIAAYITSQNAQRKALNQPCWDNGKFDEAAINAEATIPDDGDAGSLERSALGLELLGNPWGAESITESAATAAEWAESGADLSALRAYAADLSNPNLAMYKNCLARCLEAIPADDLPQFAFTFIALCELALQAPLLPQLATLRAGRVDPRELFPAMRFEMLLGAVGHVAPLQGLADVARLNLDLCRTLGWVHPSQIIAATLAGPDVVADRRSQRYIWAQAERAQQQHAFTNVLRREFDPTADGAQFRQRYGFPVIEYTDRTFYTSDKDALWWLTVQHLRELTMRQLMLSDTLAEALTVECPYRGAPAEAETLTTWLQGDLESLFGRRFPTARVVSRQ
jgi:hypothetical protein